MKEVVQKNSKTIILCGRGRCCPKITKHNSSDGDYITISDDYEGKVKLTIQESKELIEAISKLCD